MAVATLKWNSTEIRSDGGIYSNAMRHKLELSSPEEENFQPLKGRQHNGGPSSCCGVQPAVPSLCQGRDGASKAPFLSYQSNISQSHTVSPRGRRLSDEKPGISAFSSCFKSLFIWRVWVARYTVAAAVYKFTSVYGTPGRPVFPRSIVFLFL